MRKPFERRRHARSALEVPAVVRIGNASRYSAVLLDISENGCLLAFDGPIPRDDKWTVKIADLEGLKCSVQWRAEGVVGAKFEGKLHPAVVDHFVARNPRSTQT